MTQVMFEFHRACRCFHLLIDKIHTRHPQAQRILRFLDNARYNPARLAQEHLNDGIV